MSRIPESVLYSVSRFSENCWILVRKVQVGPGPRGGKRRWVDDPNWHNPGFSDEHLAETAANNLQQEEVGKEPAFLPPTGSRP